MRTALAVTLSAALFGFGVGWLAHGEPKTLHDIDRPPKVEKVVRKTPAFPERPKPPLDTPVAELSSPVPPSGGLDGTLPSMPTTSLPPIPGGPIAPLNPALPSTTSELPVADLAADEAQVRRIVIASGGRVVSSADAEDTLGRVGRNVAFESSREGIDRIATALQSAMRNRIVVSKGGLIESSTPDIRKAEDELAALQEKRDKARIDFLPEAPILVDLERSTREAERNLAKRKRVASRQRMNVLIRATAGG